MGTHGVVLLAQILWRNTQMEEMPFAAAMKHYFGPRPGVEFTASNFMAELKALTAEDKLWFRQALATVGYAVKA
jgi:hypothetical protein